MGERNVHQRNEFIVAIVFFGLLLGESRADALTILGFAPSAATTQIGSQVTVDIVADFDALVVGWGLDLSFDPSVLSLSNGPVIGGVWNSGFAPDGDGLAGLALPGGLSGTGVVLATLTFDAVGLGTSALILSVTPGDLTEGVPLLSGGFDSLNLLGGSLEVTTIPEPATALLMAAGLAAFALRRARPR